MSVENPHIIFVPNNSGYSSLQLAQRLAARQMWRRLGNPQPAADASRNRDFDLTYERSSGDIGVDSVAVGRQPYQSPYYRSEFG